MINNEVRLFCYDKFGKYKQEILKRKDTQEITNKFDLFGDLDNKEWEEILCCIRQDKKNT